MQIRKQLKLTISFLLTVGIGFLLQHCFAGSPDNYAVPVDSGPYFYVEGNFGYLLNNWRTFTGADLGAWGVTHQGGAPTNNEFGGFAAGGDIGYQVMRYIGFEFGAYYLPAVSGNSSTSANIETSQYLLEFAAKFSLNVYDNLFLYGKAGAGMRGLSYSGAGAGGSYTGSEHYFAPLFGLGLKYNITPVWSVNTQWIYFPSYAENNLGQQAPTINLFLFGVGYQLNF